MAMGWIADNSTFHSTISETADLTVAVIYSVFGVCSVLGNSMLLYVSYKKRALLKPAEYFIINLAVSDMGMTLNLYPLAVTSSLSHRWLYGNAVCVFYAFCGVLFGICSLATLTMLSAVCCLKVCYPLYGNRFSPEHAGLLILGVWCYALLFAASPLARWGAYGPEPYGTACCIDWRRSNGEALARSYTVALFVFCYAVPCAVIASSYCQILRVVRGSRRAVERHVSSPPRIGNLQTIIIKLSIAVCIGFFVAWTPYALAAMWAAFGSMDSIPPMAFAVPAVFAKSSTLYNPLVYLLLKPNFRHMVRKDLCSMHRRCVDQCLSLRSLLARSLRPLHDAHADSASSATPSRTAGAAGAAAAAVRMVVGSASSTYASGCQDTFECFRHYPRCCHAHAVALNTVMTQLSLKEVSSPPPPPPPPPPVPVPALGGANNKLIPGAGLQLPPPPRRAHRKHAKRKVRVRERKKRTDVVDGSEGTVGTVGSIKQHHRTTAAAATLSVINR